MRKRSSLRLCLSLAVLMALFVLRPPSQAHAQSAESWYQDLRSIIEDVLKQELALSVSNVLIENSPSLCFYMGDSLERMQSSNWGAVPDALKNDAITMFGDFVYFYAYGYGGDAGTLTLALGDFLEAANQRYYVPERYRPKRHRDPNRKVAKTGIGEKVCSASWWEQIASARPQARASSLSEPSPAAIRTLTAQVCEDLRLADPSKDDQGDSQHELACALAESTRAALRGKWSAARTPIAKMLSKIIASRIAHRYGGSESELRQTLIRWIEDPSLLRDLIDDKLPSNLQAYLESDCSEVEKLSPGTALREALEDREWQEAGRCLLMADEVKGLDGNNFEILFDGARIKFPRSRLQEFLADGGLQLEFAAEKDKTKEWKNLDFSAKSCSGQRGAVVGYAYAGAHHEVAVTRDGKLLDCDFKLRWHRGLAEDVRIVTKRLRWLDSLGPQVSELRETLSSYGFEGVDGRRAFLSALSNIRIIEGRISRGAGDDPRLLSLRSLVFAAVSILGKEEAKEREVEDLASEFAEEGAELASDLSEAVLQVCIKDEIKKLPEQSLTDEHIEFIAKRLSDAYKANLKDPSPDDLVQEQERLSVQTLVDDKYALEMSEEEFQDQRKQELANVALKRIQSIDEIEICVSPCKSAVLACFQKGIKGLSKSDGEPLSKAAIPQVEKIEAAAGDVLSKLVDDPILQRIADVVDDGDYRIFFTSLLEKAFQRARLTPTSGGSVKNSEAIWTFLISLSGYALDGTKDDEARELSRESFRAAAVELILANKQSGYPVRNSEIIPALKKAFWTFPSLHLRFSWNNGYQNVDERQGYRRRIAVLYPTFHVPLSRYVGAQAAALDLLGPFSECALGAEGCHTKLSLFLMDFLQPSFDLRLGIPQLTRHLAATAGVSFRFLKRDNNVSESEEEMPRTYDRIGLGKETLTLNLGFEYLF